MKIDIICNDCLKIIRTEEKDTFDYHHKDYCKECEENK